MAQPTADCNEIFERIPSVLSSRTRAVQTACVRVVSGSYRVIGNKLAKVRITRRRRLHVGEIEGLGPPDLCCLWKASAQEEAVYSHFVVGLDVSQPALIANYICGLINSQEQPKRWFTGSSCVPRALYCTYDAFQKVDLRVEVTTSATGGIGVYVHAIRAFAAETAGAKVCQGDWIFSVSSPNHGAAAIGEVWSTTLLSALLRTQKPPRGISCLRVVGQLDSTPGGCLQSSFFCGFQAKCEWQLQGPSSGGSARGLPFVDLAARCIDMGDELGLLRSDGHGTNILCELLAEHLLSQASLHRSIETLASLQGVSPLLALHISRAYARSGQLEGALACLGRCIKSFPEEACLLRQQAELLLSVHSLDEEQRNLGLDGEPSGKDADDFSALAARAAALAVEFSPQVAANWATLARCLVSCKLYSDALVALNQLPQEETAPSLCGFPLELHALRTTDPNIKRQGFYSHLWLNPDGCVPCIELLSSAWDFSQVSQQRRPLLNIREDSKAASFSSSSPPSGGAKWLFSRKLHSFFFGPQQEAPDSYARHWGFGLGFGLVRSLEETRVLIQPQWLQAAQLHLHCLEARASVTFNESERSVYEVLASMHKQLGGDVLRDMALRLFELPEDFETNPRRTVQQSAPTLPRVVFDKAYSLDESHSSRRLSRQFSINESSTKHSIVLDAGFLFQNKSTCTNAELILDENASFILHPQTPPLLQVADTRKSVGFSTSNVFDDSTEAPQVPAGSNGHKSMIQPESHFESLQSAIGVLPTTEERDVLGSHISQAIMHSHQDCQESTQPLQPNASARMTVELPSELSKTSHVSLYAHADKIRHRRLASVLFLNQFEAVMKDAAVSADVIRAFDWKQYCNSDVERANELVSENQESVVVSKMESTALKSAKYWLHRGVLCERLHIWDEMEAAYRIAITFGVCPLALRGLLRLYRRNGLIFETLVVAVVTCQQLGALCNLSDLDFLPAWVCKQLIKLMQREGVDAVCNVASSMEKRHPALDRYLEEQRLQYHTQD